MRPNSSAMTSRSQAVTRIHTRICTTSGGKLICFPGVCGSEGRERGVRGEDEKSAESIEKAIRVWNAVIKKEVSITRRKERIRTTGEV